jgi:hypothetical protein
MLATTADQLLLVFREEVGDTVAPYLWPDDICYTYMTEGCDALANDAQNIPKVLRLPYVAGTPTVNLPRSLLEIHSVRDVGSNRAIYPSNANDQSLGLVEDYGQQRLGPVDMFEGSGKPATFVRDYERKALRLVPIPDADGEIEIQGTATLSVPMAASMPLPYTEARDQRLVLTYMKWRAYSKHDAETEDLVRARKNENEFRIGVIERESQLRMYRRRPGVVRMEW